MPSVRLYRAMLFGALVALCAACASVPPVQHAFAVDGKSAPVGSPLPCAGGTPTADKTRLAPALPRPTVRVLSWNLHKNDDPGWDADLARFAAQSDLLLIQEALLTPELTRVVRDAGYDGLLAGSFTLKGRETGVLSAARVAPASACVQRAFEPLLRLPKAAAITRYEIGAVDQTLAVANVHAINFTLGLGDYRAQLQAVAQELADHRGPMIVAGDFNSWSASRVEVLAEVMRSLGLAEVLPETDTRSRFMGQQLDHVYVRGLDVVNVAAPQVQSSDHNPVLATLRLAGAR